MARKIRLTESEFHSLVRRLVRETQEEMMSADFDDEDGTEEFDYEEEDETEDELTKGEVVDLIGQFFNKKVLPHLEPEEKHELSQEVMEGGLNRLSAMFLNENLSDRQASFKEKAMMKGGLAMSALGLIGALSEFTGWSESELLSKIHEFVESFGAGNYSGPITMAMIAAGLALALRGRAKKYSRTGK